MMMAEMRSDMERIGRRVGLARVEGVLPELLVDVHALIGNGGAADTIVLGGGVGLRLPIFDRGEGTIAAYEHELDAARACTVRSRAAARDIAGLAATAAASKREHQ